MDRQRIMAAIMGVVFLSIVVVLYVGFVRKFTPGETQEFAPLPVLPPVSVGTLRRVDLDILHDPRFRALIVPQELPLGVPAGNRPNPFAPLP